MCLGNTGTIKGPPGTPYEGGVFQLEINIPSKYAALFMSSRRPTQDHRPTD